MKRDWQASYKHSVKQEKQFAEELGARQVKGSGRGREKGDSVLDNFFTADNKCTQSKSYSISLKNLDKLRKDSLGFGRWPMFNVQFIDTLGRVKEDICILDKKFLQELCDLARRKDV